MILKSLSFRSLLLVAFLVCNTEAQMVNPPAWLNELNNNDSGTRKEEHACKSGTLLGKVTSTVYRGSGSSSGGAFTIWGRNSPFTCPEADSGIYSQAFGWNFDSYDGGIAVCLYSDELGILMFVSFGWTGTATGGNCAGLTPTEAGVQDTDTSQQVSVRLTGIGCNYEDFQWTFDGQNGNLGTSPNTDQTFFACRPLDNPPVWLNELNNNDSGTRKEEHACKSGSLLGKVTSTVYSGSGSSSGGAFTIWGRNSPFTCPETDSGIYSEAFGWNFDSYDGGIAVCLYSDELGILMFVSFGWTGTATGGNCAGLTPTEAGVQDTDTSQQVSVRLTGIGCNYENFEWTFDGQNGNLGTSPNTGQTFTCVPTSSPTRLPSLSPTTSSSTSSPTRRPSVAPSLSSTNFPTSSPTRQPSPSPTTGSSPTNSPTRTSQPSVAPSISDTNPTPTSPPTPQPPPTSSPTAPPPTPSSPTTPPPCDDNRGGACMGDPHYKTWTGEWFDYHGVCDLVLLAIPSFGLGLGLNLHIRTTGPYDYSYIETAALIIGDDILEIGSYGEHFFNGVDEAIFPALMAGQYKITYHKHHAGDHVIDPNRHHWEIELSSDPKRSEKIVISTYKQMVSVKFEGATFETFENSVGMMGDFDKGQLFARDGKTILRHDLNVFGQEWQVLESEPLLFQVAREPQQPHQTCKMPKATIREKRRRLGGAVVSEGSAQEACAHWHDDHRHLCVFDVLAMGDLEIAKAGGF